MSSKILSYYSRGGQVAGRWVFPVGYHTLPRISKILYTAAMPLAHPLLNTQVHSDNNIMTLLVTGSMTQSFAYLLKKYIKESFCVQVCGF